MNYSGRPKKSKIWVGGLDRTQKGKGGVLLVKGCTDSVKKRRG